MFKPLDALYYMPCRTNKNFDGALMIKMESIRKLSNFNFQWAKTLQQNNLKNIAFFFYIFHGL